MATLFQPHPFAVEALLGRTTVLTFAAPAAQLRALLPPPFELDTFGAAPDACGFVAVALVQTTALRPRGLPAWLGNSFFLIGYRVFVRFTTPAGRRLRGLYILRSETDQRRMVWLGNLLTNYRYAKVDIAQTHTATDWSVTSEQARLRIAIELPAAAEPQGEKAELKGEPLMEPFTEPPLPAGSPFGNWREARRFAGPLPFTFSHEPGSRRVLVVQGERESWQPQPVVVRQARVGFFEQLGLDDLRLASAFTMRDIPYSWQKGRYEAWNG